MYPKRVFGVPGWISLREGKGLPLVRGTKNFAFPASQAWAEFLPWLRKPTFMHGSLELITPQVLTDGCQLVKL